MLTLTRCLQLATYRVSLAQSGRCKYRSRRTGVIAHYLSPFVPSPLLGEFQLQRVLNSFQMRGCPNCHTFDG